MPRLLDRVRSLARLRHYSGRTEQAYVFWIKRYIHFHGLRHPAELGHEEITSFLTHLASERRVAASTQNQALSSIFFLYREVLGAQLPWLEEFARAPRSRHVPVVLSREEDGFRVSAAADGRAMRKILADSRIDLILLDLMLPGEDVDFAYSQITVRDGKGGKDRVTVLPSSLTGPLTDQLARVRALHEKDLGRGRGGLRCRTPWGGSTRTRPRSGAGSSSSPRRC